MAKRFTGTDKWEDGWFRKLSLKSKLFWLFVLDRCDMAGVWKIDYELECFFIGEEIHDRILDEFEERLEVIGTDKLWATRFVEFQYGYLSKESKPHIAVIGLLKKYGLYDRVSKGLVKGYVTLKDKDKDKNKDKDKEGVVRGFDFEEVYTLYPRHAGKKDALKHFDTHIKTQEDYDKLKKAILNYRQDCENNGTEERFIKHASTFFNNNWQEWIDKIITKLEPEQQKLSPEESQKKHDELFYKKEIK